MYTVTIPMRTPSLNEYIDACKIKRGRWNKANDIKQNVQADMLWYLKKLPKFEHKINITFYWISTKDDRRDPDNICFAKKFILDALQQAGRLKNDSRKYVGDFIDKFLIGKRYEVKLEIEEQKEE